jgi:hypothetical protein
MIGTPAKRLGLVRRLLKPLFLERLSMDGDYLRRCQAEHPRLIFVINHSGPFSVVPIVSALISATAENDGERRLIGTFHPGLWNVPIVRRALAYVSSSDRHYTMGELQAALASQPTLDYYALPESDYTWFGDMGEVKPFRFLGFVEMSLRARVPMVLVAHKGSESLNRSLDCRGRPLQLLGSLPDRAFHSIELNKQFVLGEIEKRHLLNLPFPFGRVSLQVGLELHYPADFDKGIAESWKDRRAQAMAEGERIRARLQQLYDALP